MPVDGLKSQSVSGKALTMSLTAIRDGTRAHSAAAHRPPSPGCGRSNSQRRSLRIRNGMFSSVIEEWAEKSGEAPALILPKASA